MAYNQGRDSTIENGTQIRVCSGPLTYEGSETDAYIFAQKLFETEVGMERIHSEHFYSLHSEIMTALEKRGLVDHHEYPTDEFKDRLYNVDGGERAYLSAHSIPVRMGDIIESAIAKLPTIPAKTIKKLCGKFPHDFDVKTFDWRKIKYLDLARVTGTNYEYWKITIEGVPESYLTLLNLIHEEIGSSWPFCDVDFYICPPNDETSLIDEFGYN